MKVRLQTWSFRSLSKDSASLLTTPITQLCSLSNSSSRFHDACKIAKLKVLKWIPRTTVQSPSLPPATYAKSDVKIKQYSKVTYLGYELDERLLGEAMALIVIKRLIVCLNSFTGKTDI